MGVQRPCSAQKSIGVQRRAVPVQRRAAGVQRPCSECVQRVQRFFRSALHAARLVRCRFERLKGDLMPKGAKRFRIANAAHLVPLQCGLIPSPTLRLRPIAPDPLSAACLRCAIAADRSYPQRKVQVLLSS
jgi:hypothetical protein